MMSGKLIEALGLVLVKAGKGKWRFIDDRRGVERESEGA